MIGLLLYIGATTTSILLAVVIIEIYKKFQNQIKKQYKRTKRRIKNYLNK
jgi:hypothetical protein